MRATQFAKAARQFIASPFSPGGFLLGRNYEFSPLDRVRLVLVCLGAGQLDCLFNDFQHELKQA